MGANVCTCLCRDLLDMWRWPETNTSFHSQPSVNQAVSNIQEGTRRLGTGRMQGRGGGTRIIRSDCRALLTVSCTPLCPQALLLLGLNPVSTSLQDQRCENLSLASNVSGESPLPLTSHDARFSQGLLLWRGLYGKEGSGAGVSE